MTTKKRILTSALCAAGLVVTMGAIAPVAFASDSADTTGAVASVRSFPAQKHVSSRNAFIEVTSVSVSKDSKWTGLDGLSVVKTESKAQETAQKTVAADKQAAGRAEDTSTQVSRSEQRQPTTSATPAAPAAPSTPATPAPAAPVAPVTPVKPTGRSGAAVASYAMKFLGSPYVYGGNTPAGWDCSGFVQYVFGQFGISLPHSSGADMAAGVAVPSMAEIQPGDILANGSHVAIYIGNGMVVSALNPGAGTAATPVSYAMHGYYAIRRLL